MRDEANAVIHRRLHLTGKPGQYGGLYTFGGETSSTSSCSPQHLEAGIELKFFVRRNDWNVLAQGLSNDLPIKGITVIERQLKQLEGVLGGVGQNSNVQILERLTKRCSRQLQFTEGRLDGDLGQRTWG